jgi:cytochrome b
VLVWDLPVRLFHWSLALLGAFSFVTGKIGGGFWLEWHMRSGYAILTLLIFRIAWGFAGSSTARFAAFLSGPARAWIYARELTARRMPSFVGHNPLGGWMVLLLLAAFLLQATTGLFADDEIATQGPLAVKVSNAWVARMTAVHEWNGWLVAAAALFHVLAIAIYRYAFRARLVPAMVTGWRDVDDIDMHESIRPAPPARALALFAIAAAIVYAIVVVYPRGA